MSDYYTDMNDVEAQPIALRTVHAMNVKVYLPTRTSVVIPVIPVTAEDAVGVVLTEVIDDTETDVDDLILARIATIPQHTFDYRACCALTIVIVCTAAVIVLLVLSQHRFY